MNSYSRNHWYITLLSNDSKVIYPSNTASSFRNILPVPIELNTESDWEISLQDLYLPLNVANIKDPVTIGYLAPCCPITMTTANSDADFFDADQSPSDPSKSIFSNKQIEFIRKEFLLEAGYYSNVMEILNTISSQYTKLYSEYKAEDRLVFDLQTSYQTCYNKASFQAVPNPTITDQCTCDSPLTIICSNEDLISNVLGFDAGTLEILNDSGYNPCDENEEISQTAQYLLRLPLSKPLVSQKSCRLPQFNRLYIACDLVDHQYIGESSAQILESAFISNNDYKNGHYVLKCGSYSRKHNIRSGQTRIDRVEIKLYSDINHLTEFPILVSDENNHCECTLHLHRKGLA